MALESRRWFNPSQPQTLQIAVWLLYFNAVGGLIFGSVYITLGVSMALLQVLLIVAVVGLLGLFKGVALISFLFAVALVALLLHPMSRDYQRIWFK